MNIGFIGLGKLGMPVAVCMALKGHTVIGYDHDPNRMNKNNYPFKEVGRHDGETFQDMLKNSDIKFADSIKNVIDASEIIFIAIQTPHGPEFEGITRVPEQRADFDYSYLIKCLNSMVECVSEPKTVAIISTVAPGTYQKYLDPILAKNKNIRYCYNPFFIAMGTVVKDFLKPEFVLLGSDDKDVLNTLTNFYKTIHPYEVICMSVASAETTKMSYNTMIGTKIAFANSVMEMCEIFGGNVDDVMGAIKKSTDRLISTKYLTAGMGDGGGCHPRDGIALSYLAQQYNFSSDIPGMMMYAREKQTEWLADILISESKKHNLPIAVLGRAFKPETNIEVGSPAVLCINILLEKGHNVISYEPQNETEEMPTHPCVFLIGCKHEIFKTMTFPQSSIIIDPHRYIPDQEGITVRRLGGN